MAPKKIEKVLLHTIGSYEQVLQAFREFDADRNGKMTFAELHTLMCALNRGAASWTEVDTERLFHQVDKDGSGFIDVKEFVDYAFNSAPTTVASAQGAGKSNYEKVIEDFRHYDVNHNGTLDKREFTALMSNLRPGSWSMDKTETIFDQLDLDKSGELDMDELVAFLFVVPKQRIPQKGPGTEPLVVVDFECGKGMAEACVQQIANKWHKLFGPEVVVKKYVKTDITGIDKVSARKGKVVFWDAVAMLPYRENPFRNKNSLKVWLDDMCRRHIPRLLDSTKALAAADDA
eukprot:CAMPEP_0198538894 /NCGR_PEP_ID=MMETSP1462-20131121/48117_1 /TAXON_ID=1333877 /ORGANISM="Brandtodinium nutriculum, Strain RCC3387" /LENGTH=288 /DNA_ID=CAMNT_0044268929 /DNA_START=75 /DNA_END=941 /DNA_ORIENTATION=-